MARTIAHLWQKGIRSAHRLNERTHGWLGMLAGAAREALKPDSAITAAAISYFAIFSLFPLTLLSISIASFSLGSLMDQHLIVQRLEFIAPPWASCWAKILTKSSRRADQLPLLL